MTAAKELRQLKESISWLKGYTLQIDIHRKSMFVEVVVGKRVLLTH